MALSGDYGFRPMGKGGSSGGTSNVSYDYGTPQKLFSQEKISKEQQIGETQRANIAAEASRYPHILRQQRFNQAFPWAQGVAGGVLGNFLGIPGIPLPGGQSGGAVEGGQGVGSFGGYGRGGAGGGAGGGGGGFTAGTNNPGFNNLNLGLGGGGPGGGSLGQGFPQFDVGPMMNEGQIQQQVNASRASNDQSTQGQIQQMRGKLAAQGGGSNSALAQALEGRMRYGNLMTNTANDRETKLKANEMNKNYAQQGRQYASQQALGYRGQNVDFGKSALASALGLAGQAFNV